jgi:hypothetical protein
VASSQIEGRLTSTIEGAPGIVEKRLQEIQEIHAGLLNLCD